MSALKILERLKTEAWSGALGKASAETLNDYATALCAPQAFTVFTSNEFPQISETVRMHLLRIHVESLQSHVVELHDHITNLNESNSKLQKLVVALTIAALIGTCVQVWFAVKADKTPEDKSSATVFQQQKPSPQSTARLPATSRTPAQSEK